MCSSDLILPYAYVVTGKSGIKTMNDFKGKKVVIKFKTNVSLARANRALLATAGLADKDVNPVDSGGVVAGTADTRRSGTHH